MSPLQVLETAAKLESQEWQYTLEGSFIEVYNNTLRDLLADTSRDKDAGRITDQNAIKHDSNGGHTTVAGTERYEDGTDASALCCQPFGCTLACTCFYCTSRSDEQSIPSR